MTPDRPTVVSTRTLLQALALVLAALAGPGLRDALIVVFLTGVLAAALDPWIVRIGRFGLPRAAALADATMPRP